MGLLLDTVTDAPDVLSIVPPLMVNLPAVTPIAVALLMFNVPAESVVPPA